MDSKLDLLALLETDVKKVVVHEVKGLNRCIMAEEKGPNGNMELRLKTEGINLLVKMLYLNHNLLQQRYVYT